MTSKFRGVGWLTAVLVLLWGIAAVPAAAQDAVPRIDEAEDFFQQAVEAFEAGDYGMAYRRFRLVFGTFPLNRKTTAAHLMAGKALYRQGEYQQAAELLDEFIRTYATSGYLDEARRTMALSQQALVGESRREEIIDLGIALPLRDEDAALTQALFNGIRLAVEEHNSRAGAGPQVRLVFRNSGGGGASAGQAVRSLIEEGQADLIVGPLYSPEAMAAAEVAEAAEVVLVPPMATDEEVSQGRRFVFQANPSMTMRGRQMARFAIEELNHNNFGIIAGRDVSGLSERMAEGFQDEALRLGADVEFYALLPDEQAWGRLPEEIGPVQFEAVSAVYMPMTSSRANQLARAAIAGLDSMQADVRILGNSEWQGLSAAADAARYNTTYTHDFYPDEGSPEVQAFLRSFEAMSGERPTGGNRRLAFTGYDVGRYLIAQAVTRGNRPLREVLQEAPLYQGLGIRIHFDGGNVNRGLYVLQYRGGQSELLR